MQTSDAMVFMIRQDRGLALDKARANMSIDGKTVHDHSRVFGSVFMPMTAPPAVREGSMIIDDCRAAEDLTKRRLLEQVLHSKDLDGYPLVELIKDWPAAGLGVATVVHLVVSNWLKQVDRAIAEFPATTTVALATMKRELRLSRDAMSELLDLAHRLSGQANPRMEPRLLPAANCRLVAALPDRCSEFALVTY